MASFVKSCDVTQVQSASVHEDTLECEHPISSDQEEKNNGAQGEQDKYVTPRETTWNLTMKNYMKQTQTWPISGQHILAQFDDQSVVVYQAFKPSIAEYAVQHRRFGGPDYSFKRMSWIKTNFMWMMYRCGWAQKHGQERVLAIRITRPGFEDILLKALTGQKQTSMKIDKKVVEVRLQWDPDHNPAGGKLSRRAIQLGIQGKALEDFNNRYIMNIRDITDFVHKQHKVLQKSGESEIVTPLERLYTPSNPDASCQIGLDFSSEQTVVSFGT